MTTPKEDLWKTLENLTTEDFKKFKWLLKEEIPAARLEKADRQDTVDLMVQMYHEDQALRKSLQVLEKIGRNDLALYLSKIRSPQKVGLEIGLDAVYSTCESENQKKARLTEMKAEARLKIKERQMKICEIQHSIDLSRKSLERQTAESRLAFKAFIETVQERLTKLTEDIEEKQKTAQKQAEGLIRELEQEITELERLLLTEDHQKLLQELKTFSLTEVTVPQPSYGKCTMNSVEELKEILKNQMEKFLSKAKLIRMQQFPVDVTLDPDTAHPNLVLSPDGKQVYCGDAKQDLPDNPGRFNTVANVLARQSFSSGRFYFEVQVGRKTAWDVGVVLQSINRKGSITASPGGGHWTVGLKGGDTFRAAGLHLDVKPPMNKVGVFVDYENGSVVFYNVDSAELIHKYSDCTFTEKLYPFFSPGVYHGGLNSAPLVISPSNYAKV